MNLLYNYALCAQINFSLQELNDFIDQAEKGLLQPVLEGDYDGLLKVMGYLFHVKERAPTTDDMFEPIKETILLLKTYDVEFAEEVYLQLQVSFKLSFVIYYNVFCVLYDSFHNFYSGTT